jgi:hypothetical protein
MDTASRPRASRRRLRCLPLTAGRLSILRWTKTLKCIGKLKAIIRDVFFVGSLKRSQDEEEGPVSEEKNWCRYGRFWVGRVWGIKFIMHLRPAASAIRRRPRPVYEPRLGSLSTILRRCTVLYYQMATSTRPVTDNIFTTVPDYLGAHTISPTSAQWDWLQVNLLRSHSR